MSQASLIVIDEFFPDPQDVRSFALEHDFTQPAEHEGIKYPGFVKAKDERFITYLEQMIQKAMGFAVKGQGVCFVAGTEEHRTQQWIHADTTCAKFAGVIYLFGEEGFGTQFWQHGVTKTDTLPEHVDILLNHQHHPAEVWTPEEISERLQLEGKEDVMWTKTDYADSKFNRFIMFPTNRFHSRWPQHGFGDAPENCRLTITFFFDIA
jgi:hypothetical protein